MSKRLTDIRNVGRYKEVATGKTVNVKQGRNASRKTDLLYYLHRGSRVFITDCDFYSIAWVKVN